jgi:anti-sigma regulatory factor (Ser/Thr protein kinase)
MFQLLQLPRDERAPAAAREAVSTLGLEPGLGEDARLLVSELVTNSVRYGDGPHISVRLEVDPAGGLRCEVVDEGSGFLPTRPAAERDAGGWGLQLVDRIADRWGIADGTTHVWFELSATGSPATPGRKSAARTA